ncbi:retrovirus-related pol polyprotein from transposon TNT 1-94 [Tanacetum coccineum]
MDSIISLGQKNALAEYMILFGADNRPPMLDKDLYDSWKSRMELYMQNRDHRRMILESVENGPLIWPTVEENSLPTDIYSLVNHQRVAKDLWERVSLLMQVIPKVAYQSPPAPTQLMTESSFVDSTFAVPVFSPGDDPISCLNKAMAFLIVVASLRFPSTNNQLITSSNLRNQATIQDDRIVKCYNYQGEGHIARQCTQPKKPRNAAWYKEKAMLAEVQEAGQILDEEQLAFLADLRIPAGQAQTIIPHNDAFQNEDLDTYFSDCDDLSTAQAVLMANISNYGSDVILEVPHSETIWKDMTIKVIKIRFYLKKAQRIKPTLYDDVVKSNIHVAMPVD